MIEGKRLKIERRQANIPWSDAVHKTLAKYAGWSSTEPETAYTYLKIACVDLSLLERSQVEAEVGVC